jgi:aminodeoxyfutalosine synthase
VNFHDIEKKALNGLRISTEEALWLFDSADLLELGELANTVNQKRNQKRVYYNLNRHINPTNVCVKSCKFCAFSKKPGEEGAYEYSMDEIIERAQSVVKAGAREVHMVGGLHPRWSFQYYLDMLSTIKQHCPELHIKAFTAVEIDWLAAKARLSTKDTLLKLKEAGLGSMPGGGAEIFHPEIRLQICDTKTDADRWLDIHRTAHSIGLRSNCTMLYGHIEKYEHRVDHMERLRTLQDETKGFNVFIPLSFQPDDNNIGKTRYTIGEDDLRTLAVARVFLDNFPNIKAYWVMLGQDIAQMALSFGANDLDGTVVEEKISRLAGGKSGMALDRTTLESLILKSQHIPVERDTLYKPIKEGSNPLVNHELERKAETILYKFQNGEALDDLNTLVQYADFYSLAHAARLHTRSDFTFHFRDKLFDLWQKAPESTEKALESYRYQELAGIKALMSQGKSLESYLRHIQSKGISHIESSAFESELDLTRAEIFDFWSTVAKVGLKGRTKVEISSEYMGHQNIFWPELCERLKTIDSIQKELQVFEQIVVSPGKDSFITVIEFLRAACISRIALDNKLSVGVDYTNLPTLKSRQGVELKRDPALKLISVLPYFGLSFVQSTNPLLVSEINAEMALFPRLRVEHPLGPSAAFL